MQLFCDCLIDIISVNNENISYFIVNNENKHKKINVKKEYEFNNFTFSMNHK